MKPLDEFFVVVNSDNRYCWAVQLDDGSVILMDRDMRIVNNTPWQHPGMGYSGEEETLEDYVIWWLDREWWRANPEKAEEIRNSLAKLRLPDF